MIIMKKKKFRFMAINSKMYRYGGLAVHLFVAGLNRLMPVDSYMCRYS